MIFTEYANYTTQFSNAQSISECNYILISEMCMNQNYEVLTEGFVESIKNIINKFIEAIKNFFAKIKSFFTKKKAAAAEKSKGAEMDIDNIDFEDYDLNAGLGDIQKLMSATPYGKDIDPSNLKASDQKIFFVENDKIEEKDVSSMNLSEKADALRKFTAASVRNILYKEKITINGEYAKKIGMLSYEAFNKKTNDLESIVKNIERESLTMAAHWTTKTKDPGGDEKASNFISYINSAISYNTNIVTIIIEFIAKYTDLSLKMLVQGFRQRRKDRIDKEKEGAN